MLALSTKIRLKAASYSCFNELIIERDDRGDPIHDSEMHEPKTIPFIPRSIRTKNPCLSFADVNEDLRIIGALKTAQDDHKAYKSRMTEHVKTIRRLEIKIREERRMKRVLQNIISLRVDTCHKK